MQKRKEREGEESNDRHKSKKVSSHHTWFQLASDMMSINHMMPVQGHRLH
jgi:hypothetical protein